MRSRAQLILPSLVSPPNDESLHIRTDEELALRGRGLKEICDVLDVLRIHYYLSGGALLGVVREGDFIKWDFDVDIDAKTEIVRPRRDALISALKKTGFHIQEYNPGKTDFKISSMKYGTRYEITGYLKMGKMRYRRRSHYPDSFCQNGSEVVLCGEKYKTFGFPEKYLEWFYGDWKTPRRVANNYVTDRSRTGPISLALLEVFSLFKRL